MAESAVAQIGPEVGYVFPPVVTIGGTSDVQFGVFDYTDDCQWFIHDPSVRMEQTGPASDFLLTPPPYWIGPRASTNALPIPREVPARLQVNSDADEGIVRWQLANANGVSKTAAIFLSRGREILEHRSRDLPQSLPELPVAVSGRLSRLTEVDRYILTPTETGFVTVELMARRLGSDLLGMIQVRDATGRLIADFADTLGRDGRITFPVTAGESCEVCLNDLDFRGDRSFVYRLSFRYGTNSIAASPVSMAMPPEVPVDITSEWNPNDQERVYTWQAEENDIWQIRAESQAIGGSLDPSIEIQTPDGATLNSNDDLPGTVDAGLEIKCAQNGQYRCIVRSLPPSDANRPAVCHVAITRAQPGFQVLVPQTISCPLGGTGAVAVKVVRTGGFDGEISISADGLPEGITTDGSWVVPAGKTDAKLTLKSDEHAAVKAATVTFVGSASVEEKEIRVVAVADAGGDLCPASPRESQVPFSVVTATMSAPFEIQIVDRERQRDVHRGTTYPAELRVVRQTGFHGPVEIRMTAKQSRDRQGIRGYNVTVSPDETDVLYPCFMPEWLGTDLTRRIVVHGVAEVADPAGNIRLLTRAGDARITMIMEGALLKVGTPGEPVQVAAGTEFLIPVQLSRSSKLSEPATVELIVPEEAKALIRSTPVTLSADVSDGVLAVQSISDSRLAGAWQLTIRATSQQDGRWPVISETEQTVEFTVPSP
ncbi:MAG: hypothetical protein KDA96_00945 [Planctomycetaceae bacterium]|nr:hypothetical protein [Planctomycetaceae bacterium]